VVDERVAVALPLGVDAVVAAHLERVEGVGVGPAVGAAGDGRPAIVEVLVAAGAVDLDVLGAQVVQVGARAGARGEVPARLGEDVLAVPLAGAATIVALGDRAAGVELDDVAGVVRVLVGVLQRVGESAIASA
jgi:hypothetical protein